MEETKMSNIAIGSIIVGLLIGILIVVLGLNFFGVIDIEGLPKANSTSHVLIIGEPSVEEKVILDNLSYNFTYNQRSAASFGSTASEELMQYDIVLLDQSSLADKSVTAAFSTGLTNYVKKGGKVIVVKNSGVYFDMGLGNTSSDVVGWEASFGEIMPVECILGSDTEPVCAEGKEINVVARIRSNDLSSKIMQGIEIAPPVGDTPLELSTFAVQTSNGAKLIATIESENTTARYPAIVEKKSGLGTIIYFNYNPGLTPGVLKNTLDYLK
ncbi:MAG: hypothetical protein AABW59_04785 [archaeon]